jgi:hypothetical protein
MVFRGVSLNTLETLLTKLFLNHKDQFERFNTHVLIQSDMDPASVFYSFWEPIEPELTRQIREEFECLRGKSS